MLARINISSTLPNITDGQIETKIDLTASEASKMPHPAGMNSIATMTRIDIILKGVIIGCQESILCCRNLSAVNPFSHV